MTLFVKPYRDEASAAAAHSHYLWLKELNPIDVDLPPLIAVRARQLAFQRLEGSTPSIEHLTEVAAALGRLHKAAAPALTDARLDRPFRAGRLTIPDFIASRRDPLQAAGRIHDIDPARLDTVLDYAATLPASIYKDANLRNFLITYRGVAVLDFDDLTLAPYGYDLAKLIISTAMTHRRIGLPAISRALAAYNTQTAPHRCTIDDLACWAELTWLLNAPYTGRNGYTHTWPDVRPWANPL